MKAIVVRIGLLAAFALLTACKVVITVPDGATVVSESQAFSCEGGERCEIDVTDVFFDETFTVEADSGFRFMGWHIRYGGLCGGSLDKCSLQTTEFPGNSALLAILESDLEFFLEPVIWPAPENMPVLEFRDIQGEPIVRDVTGIPIGSFQGEVEPGGMGVSLHFEGFADTYTAPIVLNGASTDVTPLPVFFRSLAECESLSDPFIAADAEGSRPLAAAYLVKGDENRFYIADPVADPQEILIQYGSPGCTEIGQLTIFPALLTKVYPAIPTNFVIKFPLTMTIDGR